MKILRDKGKIDFDNWAIDKLYLSATGKYYRWSSICGDCMAKYGFTKESPEIDYDASGGVCGCLGCQHTAERDDYPGSMSYIDFDMEFVEVIEIEN